MTYLFAEIWLWLLPAFLLGLLTGYWIWKKGCGSATCCNNEHACAHEHHSSASHLAAPATGKLPTFLTSPVGTPDDLKLIKGVGEKLNATLISIGIYHFRQIANWTPEEVALVDAKLENFKGRIQRDQWIEQAKLLADNKMDEFKARFGEPGSEHK